MTDDGAWPSGKAADLDSAISGSSPDAPTIAVAEEWRPVVGWEGLYEVSSAGRVRSIRRQRPASRGGMCWTGGKVLAPAPDLDGYFTVRLGGKGKGRTRRVHKLVTLAFHGPEPHPGWQARHLDGNNQNNSSTNLAWSSCLENNRDRRKHGTLPFGATVKTAVLNDFKVRAMIALLQQGVSYARLAAMFGVSKRTVTFIARNETWKHIEREPIPRGRERCRRRRLC